MWVCQFVQYVLKEKGIIDIFNEKIRNQIIQKL